MTGKGGGTGRPPPSFCRLPGAAGYGMLYEVIR